MNRRIFPEFLVIVFIVTMLRPAAAQLDLTGVEIPKLDNFQPLPPPDPVFDAAIKRLVADAGLDGMVPAADNPDEEEEWASICVVDLSVPGHPRVGGYKMDNFIYPASAYKLYVLGEAVRQILAGEHSFDEIITVKEHNYRGGDALVAGQKTTVSEVLRLMMQYSNNTAANEAIDLVDRRRASALLRAMGLEGSDVTRKYLSRTQEDDGYSTVTSTTSSALHFATFIWAVESGAIGGGEGRGLIKAYMAMTETGEGRIRTGLPDSATLYNKTGTWNIFSVDVGLVEDGPVKYICCILAPWRSREVEPKMADFARRVHALLKETEPR